MTEFLDEPNLARLATIDADTDPHVVPVWFHWDGERFSVGADAGDHKVANVRRTKRMAIEVDSDIRRKRGILARGTARVLDGAEGRRQYLEISQAQVRRYQPDRLPMETAARMADRGDPVVIVMTVERLLSWGR